MPHLRFLPISNKFSCWWSISCSKPYGVPFASLSAVWKLHSVVLIWSHWLMVILCSSVFSSVFSLAFLQFVNQQYVLWFLTAQKLFFSAAVAVFYDCRRWNCRPLFSQLHPYSFSSPQGQNIFTKCASKKLFIHKMPWVFLVLIAAIVQIAPNPSSLPSPSTLSWSPLSVYSSSVRLAQSELWVSDWHVLLPLSLGCLSTSSSACLTVSSCCELKYC